MNSWLGAGSGSGSSRNGMDGEDKGRKSGAHTNDDNGGKDKIDKVTNEQNVICEARPSRYDGFLSQTHRYLLH